MGAPVHGQGHREGRAQPRLAVEAQHPAVLGHDALGGALGGIGKAAETGLMAAKDAIDARLATTAEDSEASLRTVRTPGFMRITAASPPSATAPAAAPLWPAPRSTTHSCTCGAPRWCLGRQSLGRFSSSSS